MPIEVITFDWGDTLATNHGQPYGYAHHRALERLEDDVLALGGEPPVDWQTRCHQQLHTAWVESVDVALNPEHREFDMSGMLAGWASDAGCDPEQPAVRAALDALCASCIELVLAYDGVEAALARLKDEGYRIGILSHVAWPGDACRAWFARRGWDRYFDFYSFSSDVGWIKPNPAHYQHALDQADCDPERILHVGDHPDRDIVGGRGYGFHTCLRLTEGIYPAERIRSCEPDLAVVHVNELPDLLAAYGQR
jgi:FMN phosphatase YigB (HAD superfamily)